MCNFVLSHILSLFAVGWAPFGLTVNLDSWSLWLALNKLWMYFYMEQRPIFFFHHFHKKRIRRACFWWPVWKREESKLTFQSLYRHQTIVLRQIWNCEPVLELCSVSNRGNLIFVSSRNRICCLRRSFFHMPVLSVLAHSHAFFFSHSSM